MLSHPVSFPALAVRKFFQFLIDQVLQNPTLLRPAFKIFFDQCFSLNLIYSFAATDGSLQTCLVFLRCQNTIKLHESDFANVWHYCNRHVCLSLLVFLVVYIQNNPVCHLACSTCRHHVSHRYASICQCYCSCIKCCTSRTSVCLKNFHKYIDYGSWKV